MPAMAIADAAATQPGRERVRRTATITNGTTRPTPISIQNRGAYGPTSRRPMAAVSSGAPG